MTSIALSWSVLLWDVNFATNGASTPAENSSRLYHELLPLKSHLWMCANCQRSRHLQIILAWSLMISMFLQFLRISCHTLSLELLSSLGWCWKERRLTCQVCSQKIISFQAKIIQKLRMPCHVDICIFHCLIQQIFGNLNHHFLREERYLSNLQLLVLQRLSWDSKLQLMWILWGRPEQPTMELYHWSQGKQTFTCWVDTKKV